MSDEPKKWPLRWIGWALIAALVLYPLSIGPSIWFREYNPLSFEVTCAIYLPLAWAADHCEPLGRAFHWYAHLYEP
jgi:hypothetical protein